jgi:hypothetical protein
MSTGTSSCTTRDELPATLASVTKTPAERRSIEPRQLFGTEASLKLLNWNVGLARHHGELVADHCTFPPKGRLPVSMGSGASNRGCGRFSRQGEWS